MNLDRWWAALVVVSISCSSNTGNSRDAAADRRGQEATVADRAADRRAADRPASADRRLADRTADRRGDLGGKLDQRLLEQGVPKPDLYAGDLGPAPATWLLSAGGTHEDSGNGITVNAAGESFVVGSFTTPAQFGASTLSCPTNHWALFVAKLAPQGSFKWVTQAGCTSGSSDGASIALAPGGMIVTGSVSGTASFGSTTISVASGQALFVTKLDSSGSFVWATAATCSKWITSNAVAVDGAGNSYITGTFMGQVTFGTTTLVSKGATSSIGDLFVAKLDASGAFVWAVAVVGDMFASGLDIAVDAGGAPVLAGQFCCKASLGATTLTSSGGSDALVAKLDTAGGFVWAASGGGISEDDGSGVAVAGGDVFVTGSLLTSGSFGGIQVSTSGPTAYVAKLDGQGSFVWVTAATVSGGNSQTWGRAIVADATGDSWITGGVAYSATFGATTLSCPLFGTCFYVAHVDPAGKLLSAVGGSSSQDGPNRGEGLGRDGAGNLYVTGFFAGFATAPGGSITAAGQDDIFVWRAGSL
jgi:hypothetical protein